MSERLIRAALAFFAAAAALGAAFALAGPAPFVRLLGVVALAGGIAGCALQIYAMRTYAPHAYAAWRTARAANLSAARGSPARAA